MKWFLKIIFVSYYVICLLIVIIREFLWLKERDVAPLYELMVRDGSSDRSFMVDPLGYFLFQPVLHYVCNKFRGMCYPGFEMMYIKEP